VTGRATDETRPYIRVVADIKAEGEPCGKRHRVEVVRGPVPEGKVTITAASSEAVNGMRANLRAHEKMATQLARRFCAEGVSVLSATEADGAVSATSLALWRQPRPGEKSTREPGSGRADAGPEQHVDAGDLGKEFEDDPR
jgi:hypothetical protein